MVSNRALNITLAWLLVVMIILTATLGLLVSKQEQLKLIVTAETPLSFPDAGDGVKTGTDYYYFDLAFAAMPDTVKENNQKVNIFDECCLFSLPYADYFSEIKPNITGTIVSTEHMPVLDKVVLLE